MDDATAPPGPAHPAEGSAPPPPPPPVSASLPPGAGAAVPPPPSPGWSGDGTLAASMPERTGTRWVKPLVIAAAALVVVAGLGIGAIAFVLRGSSDVITSMVPDDASVYATVYLDPSLGQKLALRDLLKRFPATDTSAELDQQLQEFFDSTFQDSGLSFETDIKPWVGGQLGVVAKVTPDASNAAVLVASRDDAAAQAALDKLRAVLRLQHGETFAVQQHGGVNVTVGSTGSGVRDVLTLVSHTVILGSSIDVVNEVIDTAQRKHANITGKAEYTKVFGALPKDKLAFVYVNAASMIKDFEDSLGLNALPAPGSFAALEAYRGLGVAVSASSSGIAADMTVDIDPSKLSADERQALGVAPHANTVLLFTPQSAYGVLAVEGITPGVRQAIDSLVEEDPDAQELTDQYGLTGPNNIVDHLTGDAGLTVGPGTTPDAFPGIALMAGTTDGAGFKRFLEAVAADAGADLSDGSWRTENYQGVTITFMPATPDSFLPISPAYAVGRGMAIVASSPEEVKAILDARAGSNITSAPNYTAAVAGSVANANSMFYADVEAIAGVVRDQLPPDERASYDANVAPNLEHLKAFVVSGASSTERQTVRMFLLVK